MNDGGAAFPIIEDVECDSGYRADCLHEGMSLRDWFAGQALAVIASWPSNRGGELPNTAIASFAYNLADAMLAAREAKSA